MSQIYWVCVACNEINLDDDELTAVPMCSNCEAAYDWCELEEWSPKKEVE